MNRGVTLTITRKMQKRGYNYGETETKHQLSSSEIILRKVITI